MRLTNILLTVLIVGTIFTATIDAAKRGFNVHIDLHKTLSSNYKGDASLLRGSATTYQYFTQRVDHFNQFNTQTFQQRYLINDAYWDGTGPVFFMLNGEGPMGPESATAYQYVAWAQKFNALVVTLEHRFYGASFVTSDLSTESLQYLNSQQALADNAVFRNFIEQSYKVPSTSKWVTFGGSYSGALTSWFKIKYPHLVDITIASSAPVNAQTDFSQYLEVVQNSLLTAPNGQECVQNIAQATAKIQSLLQQTNYGGINDLFNLCPPLQSQNDVANFMLGLAGNFMGVVQYNAEEPGVPTINDLCSAMTANNDPLTNYLNVWNQFAGGECVDVSYESMINEMTNITNDANAIGGRMWFWQTCTEFGYFQTTDSPNQPFGDLVSLQFNTQQCSDVFGFTQLPNTEWTATCYGGLTPKVENILYVNGNIDPWHALGITSNAPNGSEVLIVNGGAHCSDMMVPSSVSPPGLVPAQQVIQNYLAEKLAQ
eukprot:gene7631-9388_t